MKLKITDIITSSIPMKIAILLPAIKNLLIIFQDAGRTDIKQMDKNIDTLEKLSVKRIRNFIIFIRTNSVPISDILIYISTIVKKLTLMINFNIEKLLVTT